MPHLGALLQGAPGEEVAKALQRGALARQPQPRRQRLLQRLARARVPPLGSIVTRVAVSGHPQVRSSPGFEFSSCTCIPVHAFAALPEATSMHSLARYRRRACHYNAHEVHTQRIK